MLFSSLFSFWYSPFSIHSCCCIFFYLLAYPCHLCLFLILHLYFQFFFHECWLFILHCCLSLSTVSATNPWREVWTCKSGVGVDSGGVGELGVGGKVWNDKRKIEEAEVDTFSHVVTDKNRTRGNIVGREMCTRFPGSW